MGRVGCFWPWNDFLLADVFSAFQILLQSSFKKKCSHLDVATLLSPTSQYRVFPHLILGIKDGSPSCDCVVCLQRNSPKREGNSINIHLPRHVCWRSRTFQGSRNQLNKLVHAPPCDAVFPTLWNYHPSLWSTFISWMVLVHIQCQKSSDRPWK